MLQANLYLSNLQSFYRNKRVLITGHSGFKGAWLAMMLTKLGAEVMGFAKRGEPEESLYYALTPKPVVHEDWGDIENLAEVTQVFNAAAPDIVFHLAAQALVRPSLSHPTQTFATNVMGTVNVLEVCRRLPTLQALVLVTSDKCYADQDWLWGYRENDRLGGRDPYSASKSCAELVFQSYVKCFYHEATVQCASARAGNVIGGGDAAKLRLVPDIVTAIQSRQPLRLRAPQATRAWQHVLDPLHGYLRLAQKIVTSPELSGQSWNFGPSFQAHRSVLQVVQTLMQYWQAVPIEEQPEAGYLETCHLYLQSDKACRFLDWQCQLDFTTSIQMIADWYRAIEQGASPHAITLQQINSFFGKIAAQMHPQTILEQQPS